MPIGCRYDGFSQTEAVGQRAGRHLGFIEIRCDIDVAERDEFQQRRLVDELVEEHDMVFDAEFPHAGYEAFPITLTMMLKEIRMRCAENDIKSLGARLED